MSRKFFFLMTAVLFFSIFSQNLFCETDSHEAEPYNTKELPQAIKDFRRFEIITLGSIPFVMLDTTLVYSGIRYAKNNFDDAYKPNIFDSSSYTTDEQIKILLTSAGISLGIGTTDFIVNLIKRQSAKNRKKKQNQNINITPVSQDPDAVRLNSDTISHE